MHWVFGFWLLLASIPIITFTVGPNGTLTVSLTDVAPRFMMILRVDTIRMDDPSILPLHFTMATVTCFLTNWAE